jgi:hypothetical protein
MRKIAFIFSVIAVAILAITLFVPGEHEKRMAKIDELKLEALDGDTVKYATTQGDIDSLLKRVDKEYSITDDHDIRICLISQREFLEYANSFNMAKWVLIQANRIRNRLSASNTINRYVDLPRDPGRKSDSLNILYKSNSKIYSDLPRDPGRNA